MKKILPVLFALGGISFALSNLPLTVRRERLGKGIKTAHVSDLHKRSFGGGNTRLCEKIIAESPDLILISGDFVSRTTKDFSVAEETLSRLCRIAPVYMIFGNHEQSLPPKKQREFLEAVGRTDVILLRNASSQVNINGRELTIYGLEESYSVYKKNDSYRDLDSLDREDITSLVGACPEGEVLLLAHNPFFGQAYSDWGADYVLSGHVHGGAVRLFGVGMLSPERKLFPKFSKGVYTIGKTRLLVSAGLGKPRLFNPPELVIYEI